MSLKNQIQDMIKLKLDTLYIYTSGQKDFECAYTDGIESLIFDEDCIKIEKENKTSLIQLRNITRIEYSVKD
jgi:hypothetical protein